METKIKSFKELRKPGQVLLIDTPLTKDDVCVLSSVMKVYGEARNEVVDEYSILSSKLGSYTFKEDDNPKLWNVRIISKDHPKYDKSILFNLFREHLYKKLYKKLIGENF